MAAAPDAWDDERPAPRPVVLLLAYLVIADGRPFSSRGLARRTAPANRDGHASDLHWLGVTANILRQRGLDCIEAFKPAGRITGYRLVKLPPDDLLEDVLAAIDELRRCPFDPADRQLERWLRMPPDATKLRTVDP